jgi:hypothetical protein
MKPDLRMGIVTIALLSSVGMAAAAGAMSPTAATASMAKASSGSLTLSKAQQKTIWQDVSKQNYNAKAPAGFTAKVGDKVPSSVMLHPLPTDITNAIAATRPYEYAMLDKNVLIVNPTDKTIVDVITQSSASG